MDIDGSTPIVSPPRITRQQALAFTESRPIGRVAGTIYDVAQSLGIDPAFALAEAILETGWGSSPLAQQRHNWYGYMAYLNNPDSARSFADDSEGIRIPLQDILQHYCSTGGLYYDGGRGGTLAGWARNWVDGSHAHWQDAVAQIIWLMEKSASTQESS
jgi:hypothetical protein